MKYNCFCHSVYKSISCCLAGRLTSRSRSADPSGPRRLSAARQPGPSRRSGQGHLTHRNVSAKRGQPYRRATPSPPEQGLRCIRAHDNYQNNVSTVSALTDHYECPDGTGPYIPISECITGVRAQDEQRAFTFDPKNIMMSTRIEGQQLYSSQSHFRLNTAELSENESNLSDEEEVSLHASHQNIHWSVTKSFTKLTVTPKKNGGSEDGPPVPPRPPKTFATLSTRTRDAPLKDPFQGPKIQEPPETSAHENALHQQQQHPPLHHPQQHQQQQQLHQQQQQQQQQQQRLRVPRRMSQGAPTSPGRLLVPVLRTTDDEEETSPGHASMQYCNLPSLPPAVDRALKPRHSSVSVGHINAIMAQGGSQHADETKPDVLQYLDLDLHTSKPPQSKGADQRSTVDVNHGKSLSAVESDSAYKTVDFLKTEAFNITRQDAEASRSFQY
ncbi:histone-lysine N-methyltransferase 2D-like isoform X2 [Trichoplusia ni]|uniref:Histone-lysine N-methyltransferase 2D-like isoform X2 n=1 Tax=Trichoplusia ni TaxID=7111 RepID=A0A7E5VI11_TRINI|nr:histone-lysine N-methyltransferase 2D-like isoform X2 [Trichoplusia ni]